MKSKIVFILCNPSSWGQSCNKHVIISEMDSLEVEEQNHENIEDMFEFVDIVPNDVTPVITVIEDFDKLKQEQDNIKKEDLKDHIGDSNNVPIKGDDKKYSCPHCDYKTRRGEECQEHINGVHVNIKPHLCIFDNCGFATSYRNGLRKHIASVHEENKPLVKPKSNGQEAKKHSCQNCDFKTNKNSYLVEHINGVHENIKPYICTHEDCFYATSYKGSLKKHIEAVHLNLKHEKPREKKWICTQCDYKTGRERYLKEHIMCKHDNIKPFVCTYEGCKFASASGSSLKKHIDNVHLKIKDNLCDQCDFTAFSKNLLRLHVASKHGSTKPFICSYVDCDYATVYPGAIRNHTNRVHLKLKPLLCERENCTYATDSKSQLLTHISAVHDKTLAFFCEYSDCEYRSNFKSNMKLHVNKVHLNLIKDDIYQCEFCDYRAKSMQMIKWHFTARHTDAVEKCPHCKFESKWKTSMKSHIKIVHEGAKGFNCDLCDYECSRKYRLKAHYDGVHLGISHQCPECPMISNWKHKIDQHYKEVHNNQDTPSYFCDQCDFQTFRRCRLKPHIYFKHGEGSAMEFLKDDNGYYICDQCEFKSFKREPMKFHHFKGKHCGSNQPKSLLVCEKYTCDQCVFQTMSPRKFSLHIYYKHGDGVNLQFFKNDDEIYQCDKCDFNTLHTTSIKSHHFSGKHTAVFQRMCKVCSYEARSAIDMKHHNYFSHGDGVNISVVADSEGNFKCDRCKYTSANETQLRYHLMMGAHKSEGGKLKIKTCDQCDFSTKYGGDLRRHVYYKHGEGVNVVFSLDSDAQYQCDQCSYKYGKMSNIKTHFFNNHVKNVKSKLTE